jgi:hypothetical protein
MPKSSYEQAAFTGGEVSPLAQGRSDQPWYRQAMSLSLNGVTVEEGAWVRRSGFEFLAPTRGRTYANILPFDGSATCSFGMVFTDDNLQFVSSTSLIFDNTIGTIATSTNNGGTSLEITLAAMPSETWAQGDQVMLVFPDASSPLYPYSQALEMGLRNRLLTLGPIIDQTHFYLYTDLETNLSLDPVFQLYVAGALVGAQIMRVLNFSTPYATVATLENLRSIQIEYQNVILSQGTAPQVVQITTQGSDTTDPTYSFSAVKLVDGPYLDPTGDTGSVNALTGTVTFTATADTPFASTDVGRHLRMLSQPAAWASGTAYTAGEYVTDSAGAWWVAIIASTGVVPGTPTVVGGVQQLAWAPAPQAGTWAWGVIASYVADNEVTVALDTSIPNMVLSYTTIALYQLGVYSATPAPGTTTPCYPTCGVWTRGRLWLGGAIPNRFDTTISNGVGPNPLNNAQVIATFSPTDPWDNVLDSSGISEVMNSSYVGNIVWMTSEAAGVLMGTLNGEFLVAASSLNDPITPADIDSNMVTKFGGAFQEPVHAGMATVFVHKYGRRVIEYLADALSGKFSGIHLNEYAKHLFTSGVARLAYQEETWPCVWALMNNGLLAGCTYRRKSRFVSEPPTINAWTRHLHGRQRTFTSMCVIPDPTGLLDRLITITNDPPATGQPPVNNYFIEVLQPLFDEGMTSVEGFFCDEAPGTGVGNSGYDCGGGNASQFLRTGGTAGADTTTPNVSGLFPYDGAGIPAGQPLDVHLQTQEASYLDGRTALYMLPTFGAPTDETSLSLSVWVGAEDFPQQAGALFASPALSDDEAQAATKKVSTILGGNPVGFEGTQTALAECTSGNDVYPYSKFSYPDGGNLAGGQVWNHIMISMKSTGSSGLCEITVAMNETVIASAVTGGDIANNADAWPFATQPGGQKDVGIAVWCIGGNMVTQNDYNITYQYAPVVPTPLAVPTLAQLMQAEISSNAGFDNGIAYPGNAKLLGAPASQGIVAALASYISYIQNLNAQMASQVTQKVVGETLSGGFGNLPVDMPLGGYSGYRGSVAELLIWPGKFIDWTQAGNRAALHHFDNTTNQYRPLSVGSNGSGTILGAPYVYLSGPPTTFPINRVTGKALAVTGTGIIASDLTPP